MITIVLFALTAGIVGFYFELPILEKIIRQRPFDSLTLIFYAFPFAAAFGGGMIGYGIARLISLSCLKTMKEIETTILEPIMISNRLYYLLKRRSNQNVNRAVFLFFARDQSGKNTINQLPAAKWVKIKEGNQKGAMLKIFKEVFVQPKLKFWARLSSQETYIISVPKNAIFDGATQ